MTTLSTQLKLSEVIPVFIGMRHLAQDMLNLC